MPSLKDLELVLTIRNDPSIHYGSANYIHIEPGGNEAWKSEVLSDAPEKHFVERWLAESDSSILQLIPYVVCHDEEGRILSYKRRGGGEERLEGNRSIGIGGHVNYMDLVLLDGKVSWSTVVAGAAREMHEELGLDYDYAKANLKERGILYIPSDDLAHVGPGPSVGEVHLGIIYTLEVPSTTSIMPDEGMIEPHFSKDHAQLLEYEPWSRLVLQHIKEILL